MTAPFGRKELLLVIDIRWLWREAQGIPWWKDCESYPRRCKICKKPEIYFDKYKTFLISQWDGNSIYYICDSHGDELDTKHIIDCFTGINVEIFVVHKNNIFLDRWFTEGLYWLIVLSRFVSFMFKTPFLYLIMSVHRVIHKIENVIKF